MCESLYEKSESMNEFITLILLLAGVGALVGAATNYMAIKMLFRPYKPIYFYKWRLPLTPGLIPKRRGDLAIQLGNTVSEYLLTPNTIKKKFLSPEVRQSVLTFAQAKVAEEIFDKDKTIYEWMQQGGFGHVPSLVEQKVDEVIATQIGSLKNTLSTKTIRELLPEDVERTLDEKVAYIPQQILKKGEDYFVSTEGTAMLKNMLDDFLLSKGSFGGMIQMFVGDGSSLVEKIKTEIIGFLRSPRAEEWLENLISNEYEKVKARHAMDFLVDFDFEQVTALIQQYAKKEIAVEDRLNKRISDYWPDGKRWATEDMLPKLTDKLFVAAEEKIEDILKRLNLQEVVREQVDSYPIAKLEELVLGIISKELKLITWLGGIIGGIVGFIQALVVYFIN